MPVFARRTQFALAVAALLLCGCQSDGGSTSNALNVRTVKLPDGTRIRAEFLIHEVDLIRGMKYRKSLAPDAGMLFAYGQPGQYPYWMYEVEIPLDIIWLDSNRKIVQLIHNVPPCKGPSQICPAYGGSFPSLFVLELNAGMAKKHNLKPGMAIDF